MNIARALKFVDEGDPLILNRSVVVHMIECIDSNTAKVLCASNVVVVNTLDLAIPASKLPDIMEKIELEDEASARAELLKCLLDGADSRALANKAAKLKYAKEKTD